mmetsp:Transcript_2660/g.6149  ORF Transcript_2660/g.6149 Transcript_2660/m.6149 type:complete len:338 (-) Transcript_2660:1738-2751(-)
MTPISTTSTGTNSTVHVSVCAIFILCHIQITPSTGAHFLRVHRASRSYQTKMVIRIVSVPSCRPSQSSCRPSQRVSQNDRVADILRASAARAMSSKRPAAKPRPLKVNNSLKKLERRGKLQNLHDANSHFLRCMTEMEAAVATSGSSRLVGAMRKMRAASAGVAVTSNELTKEVKKEAGSYCEYVHRRKSAARGIKAATSMPGNVIELIKSAKAASEIGDHNRYGKTGGSPPRKKMRNGTRELSACTCTAADKDVTRYEVSVLCPAETVCISVPNPSSGSLYQPLELARILSKIETKFRRKLAACWKEAGLVEVSDQQCARLCKLYPRRKRRSQDLG